MRSDIENTKRAFDEAIDHIYTAYRFFAAIVPQPEQFTQGVTICIGDFEFQKPSQARSMEVELGWAFFTRLYAAFEAFTSRLHLTKKCVADRLKQSGQFSEWEIRGIETAWELRNIVLHGDGDADLLRKRPIEVQPKKGHEPHLDEIHIKNFVELFRKATVVLTRPTDQTSLVY